MNLSDLNFDANNVEPNKGFDVLPADDYTAIIESSEMKNTKDGNGKYLKLSFQIIEGEFSGRKLWTNLNIVNDNPKAVEIAKADLSAICRAVGVMTPKDSNELHNKPLTIKVVCKKRKDNGEMENKIDKYIAKETKKAVPGSKAGWMAKS